MKKEKCCICLQKIENRFELPKCEHNQFCHICIQEWIKYAHNCPISGCGMLYHEKTLFDTKKNWNLCLDCMNIMITIQQSLKQNDDPKIQKTTFSNIVYRNQNLLCDNCKTKV